MTLNCEFLARMTDSKGREHLGYVGKVSIDRRDWGMTYGFPFAGNNLDLEIDIEADK